MIKSIGEMNQTLKAYDANNWAKTQEIDVKLQSPQIDLEGGAISQSETPKTFGEFLRDSISQVNGLQNEANVAMEKLASGESKNLHETLIAVEKADIAFRMMNQIRTKVLDAYKEIMKTQI